EELAEQLVAPADREEGSALLNGLAYRLAVARCQVAADRLLFAVLPGPAEERNVACRGFDPVADGHIVEEQLDVAPGTAALEREDVAPIAIEVHQVAIEVDEA